MGGKETIKMLERYRISKRAHIATLFSMFLVMLLFNVLTQRFADDYMYLYSFVTDEKLSSLSSIIESLIQHGKEGNGRYFAHFFACVFLILPDIVFDLVNSAVFVSVIYIMYRIANGKNGVNNSLLIAIFGLIWLFQLDFGQVCLWLDGSCNYLFGVFFGLLFLLPYIRSVKDKKNTHPLLLLLHLPISLILGGYLEPLSVGFIAAAGLFLIADLFCFKNLRALALIPSMLAAFLGLAIMALAPGEITNKLSGFGLLETLAVIGVALLVLASVTPLIILFVVLYRRARSEGADRRITLSALIIAAGALASNTVMLIATYYPLRCSVAVIFLTVLAVSMLFGAVKNKSFGRYSMRIRKVFTVVLLLALLTAAVDNAFTYAAIEEHEDIIAEAKENGENTVELYNPIAVTRYNGVRFLIYLDTEGADKWPNNFYAKYYGLDGATGRSLLKERFGHLIPNSN